MGLGPNLLGAAFVHAVVVASVAHLRPPPPAAAAAVATSAEIDIAIDRALALPDIAAPVARWSTVSPASPPPARRASTSAAPAAESTAEAHVEADFALDLHPGAAPAVRVDLGTDSYWRTAAASAASTSSAAPPDVSPVTGVARMMRDDTEARDVSHGLGSSGPLLAAARDAASIASAPDVGRVSVDIDCDADGKVTSARLRGATGDWEPFRQELVRLMATRSVRIPPGAHGLRVSLHVESERRLPSGKEVSAHPGAVADDMPSGVDEKGCEGTGWTRKCLTGMPVGITLTGADLTNLAARAHRMIRVALEGESRL